jgi:hypothetical protein
MNKYQRRNVTNGKKDRKEGFFGARTLVQYVPKRKFSNGFSLVFLPIITVIKFLNWGNGERKKG